MSTATATKSITGQSYIPRPAQRRGEVKSWTPLHLRERIAKARCWWVDDPRKARTVGLTATAVLTLEHWQTSFPWIITHAQTTAHVVSACLHVL